MKKKVAGTKIKGKGRCPAFLRFQPYPPTDRATASAPASPQSSRVVDGKIHDVRIVQLESLQMKRQIEEAAGAALRTENERAGVASRLVCCEVTEQPRHPKLRAQDLY